ncbi:MAG: type II toxin-antitoxin system HipA family toxin, partial [Herminiimonas sp.]|nr:type II toxin-antitoxin system HipA family toxin [Herminiimonas sp.]
MATRHTEKRVTAGAASKVELDVCLGQAGAPVGKLIYVKDGPREFSQFAYRGEWLASPAAFDISPDLFRILGHQLRKAPSRDDSCFFLALADTEPDSWGRRVIARAHAKERQRDPALRALTELDYLCAVDDFSRIGALRLRDAAHTTLRTIEEGKRATPPLLELEKMMTASRAVELSKETAEDLEYLQGKGTSLGGMRPKCTVLDADGTIALGKFPSVGDERSVTRGEVLAMRLAKLAGIETAHARIVMVQGDPVAIIRRFDRTPNQGRIPYLSGATLLQSSRNEEHSYTEVVDAMRSTCIDFSVQARQLWRRLVFNFLVTNVDDHLQNIGFLYVNNNQWQLSPAFDLNPFPDKDRESKTWLSEDTGPITTVAQLLGQATRFQLHPHDATAVLAEVVAAVRQWRNVALAADVGLSSAELRDFAPAF